ncbi:MAG: leucyl aminopeptidase [Acidimicrobiales bacterium]
MLSLKLTKSPNARAAVVALVVPSDRLRASGVDKRLLTRLRFEGKAGQVATITGDTPALTILVGIGPSVDVTTTSVRKAVAAAVGALSAQKSAVVDLSLVDLSLADADLSADDLAQAAAEGAGLTAYRYEEYKAPKDDPRLESLTLVVPGGGKDGFARGQVIVDAVCFARDLVNEPGGSLTPVRFADLASERATAAGLTVEVLDRAEIEAAALGGVLSVNRGSSQEPRFVKLTYTPTDAAAAAHPSVALVGKGITFDSGGLSIKTGEGMMTMKCDMGGAAAVIATMCALPALGVGVPVTSYTPMTDNMTGPDATRPGDVMTARNGKTVEILNTDAEGRLVLADALSLATEDGHGTIVDLATLTGACMVALGDQIAGLLGNDDELIDEIAEAADRAGEKVWHLPLPPEYRKLLDSPIADMKNLGGRYGGTLTAGLFLQEFVGDDVAWVHLDIAGPSFTEAADAEIPRGGTGFGVRTLLDWLEFRAASLDVATLDDDLIADGLGADAG